MKITKNQQLKIAKTAKKFQLKLVIVFGSFASGKDRKDSDLDIAILGSRTLSFNEQVDLINKFSIVFKKEIDLSLLNNANPLLLFEASKNSVLVYGNKQEFFKFKLRAFNAYNDYAPYFEMENNLNRRIINAYAH